MDKIRIAVVDDHPLFLDGVIQTLESKPGFCVVGKGSTASEALTLAVDTLPDVVLLDISMPGGGISAARDIALACPVVRIGMLTVSESDDDVFRSLQAGAHGYILKGISGADLIAVVNALNAGDMYVSPGLAAQLLTESKTVRQCGRNSADYPLDDLTQREEQILQGISKGLSNREIGEELHITEKTVKNYVTNILQKLHVRNRVQAAMFAQNREVN